MVDQFRSSVRVKEQPCVEPGEVPCDVYTGTQLKAVKSCLVCLISYCQTHLEPHQRVAGLKKHRLVEPLDRLERQDVREYEVKTAQPGKIEAELQQMIKERQRKIKDIIDTVDHSKADADREIADGVQRKKLRGLIKELEQEIKDLTNRSSEVKQFNQTEDHLHLLQTFRSLKDPPRHQGLTTVEVRPPSYIGTLRRALDQLEETLNMEVKKVPDLRSALHKYACDLTLDPNTATETSLCLRTNRKVTWVEEDQSVSPGGGGSSDTLTHLHTFCSSFTQEDLLPGVGVGWSGASASLCRL
ncbi:unnamed protein product [Gadus morhua 'NCC']